MKLYVYQWYLNPGEPTAHLLSVIQGYAPPDATHCVEVHYTQPVVDGTHYAHRESYDEDHPAFQELMTLVLLGRATMTELERNHD